jgi:hypothetical protein
MFRGPRYRCAYLTSEAIEKFGVSTVASRLLGIIKAQPLLGLPQNAIHAHKVFDAEYDQNQ